MSQLVPTLAARMGLLAGDEEIIVCISFDVDVEGGLDIFVGHLALDHRWLIFRSHAQVVC